MRPFTHKLVDAAIVLVAVGLVVGVWKLFHGDVVGMLFAAAFLAMAGAGIVHNNH